MPSPSVKTTPTVALTVDASPGRLRADVRVSSSPGNGLSAAAGLFVRKAGRPAMIAGGMQNSVATGVGTTPTLATATALYDPDGCVASGTPTRCLPPAAGWYLMAAYASFSGTGGVIRLVRISLNGATNIAYRELHGSTFAAGDGNAACDTVYYMNGTTDYVEIAVLQDTGSNQNVASGLAVVRIG